MPVPPTIKGDNTVLWGTDSGTTLAGIIVRVRNQLTGEMVEVADENGYTVSVIFFNEKNECEVEMIVQTSYPAIARGDLVTIMGATAHATEYEKVWEQKGVRKYTLKATRWAGLTCRHRCFMRTFRTASVVPLNSLPIARSTSIAALSSPAAPMTVASQGEEMSTAAGLEKNILKMGRTLDEDVSRRDRASTPWIEQEARARMERGVAYEKVVSWLESLVEALKALADNPEADLIRVRSGSTLAGWLRANATETGAVMAESEVLKRMGISPERVAKYA